jgi:glycine hydroxymethyltransferase
MDVDLPRLAAVAHELRPALLIVGGSMCLHPYDVRGVRAVADEIGAHVLYDAAHMGGLIAGGRFQQPLAEGAHAITGSTYKSFGGPPSGMILTDDPALAERLDRIAFPGLTANFDLARQAALALAALDLLEHGGAYADLQIANAQALAAALAERGVPVLEVAGRGATSSQHVALPTADPHTAARRLEAANVLVSEIGIPAGGALRLGTQELTRRGLEPAGTAAIAEVMARVLVRGEAPESVRPDVTRLRRQLGSALRFIRAEDGGVEREHRPGR